MSTHFGPMAGGMDLDMESGAPAELGTISRQAQAEERRNRRVERHAALIEDLAGHGGVVLTEIAHKLALRIDTLMAQDPEAMAYVSLLRDFSRELQVGERIVQDEMNALLRKELEDG